MTSKRHQTNVRSWFALKVYLTEEQHLALRRAAERDGVSMTAFLRRMVEQELLGKAAKRDYPKQAIMAFIGLGSAEPDDTSERHNEALDEAFRE